MRMSTIIIIIVLIIIDQITSFRLISPPNTFVPFLHSTLSQTQTELPNDVADSARLAAEACRNYYVSSPLGIRASVIFDASKNDETFTRLKSSSEFAQEFVTSLSTINFGIDGSDNKNNLVRVYFPDEGSSALAKRDWVVPPNVNFSSLGRFEIIDTSKDNLAIFYCPKASEAETVELFLSKLETNENNRHNQAIFVNANLINMGVTGLGLTSRLLRERLLDDLEEVYCLKQLPWGALTRCWPREFTLWQQDETKEDGYRKIKQLGGVHPLDQEVEDTYDIENGLMEEKKTGLGFLDTIAGE